VEYAEGILFVSSTPYQMDDSLSADDQKGDYSCLEILEPLKIMPHN
jgi:hypothetical protein